MKRLTARQYALALLDVLEEAAPAARPGIVRSFLVALRKRHQLKLLPRIVQIVELLADERSGTVRVSARTARPLPASVSSHLSHVLGKRAVVDAVTDPSLIGGIQLRVGERLIDGSIPTLLDSLRTQLHRA